MWLGCAPLLRSSPHASLWARGRIIRCCWVLAVAEVFGFYCLDLNTRIQVTLFPEMLISFPRPILFVELWCSALLTWDDFRVNVVTWLSLRWVRRSGGRAVVVGLMRRRVRDWVGKLGRGWPGLGRIAEAASVLLSWSKHQLRGVILSLGESYQR